MTDDNSARQILRSSSLIGAASVANVLTGLVRNKLAALLLGPAGFGLIALVQSLVTSLAQVGGLGLANAAVRQLSQADEEQARASVRRALFLGSLTLAALTLALLWLLQKPLGAWLLPDEAAGWSLGLIALAAALTILATTQQFLLTGLRQIGRLALLNVGGALTGTLLGVGALYWLGSGGIPLYILAAPVGALVVGVMVLAPLRPGAAPSSPRLLSELRPMLSLGVPLMLGNLLAPVAQLAIRSAMGDQLGAAALGYYGAASMISVTYIGFVLSAMATDYYPRVSAAFPTPLIARRVVLEQAEIALLLAAPLFLGLQATAPWVLHALYSSQFVEATPLLRWLVLGDTLKTLGWPLGYLLLASGRGKIYIAAEALFALVLVGGTLLLLPRFGVEAAGIAYFAMMSVYLLTQFFIARRLIGLLPGRPLILLALAVIGSVAALALVGSFFPLAGLAIGLPLSAAAGLFGLLRLAHLTEADNRIGRTARTLAARIGR